MWSAYSCSSPETAFNTSDSCLLHTQSSCLCNCVFILKYNSIVYALCVSSLRGKQLKQMLSEDKNTAKLSIKHCPPNKMLSLTHFLFKCVYHPETAAVTTDTAAGMTTVAGVTVPLSSHCFGNRSVVSSLSSLYLSIHRHHLVYALCSSFTPSLLSLFWHDSLFTLLFNSLPLCLSPCALPLSWCLSELAGDKVICESSELS